MVGLLFTNEEHILPSKIEQEEIINYCTQVSLYLYRLITKTINVIDCLAKYRTSLTTSAVTGKIDVRNFKIPPIKQDRA